MRRGHIPQLEFELILQIPFAALITVNQYTQWLTYWRHSFHRVEYEQAAT